MTKSNDPGTIALPTEHLTYDEVEAYVDGRADADDRELVREHIAQCDACRGEVRDLEQMRDAIAAQAPHPRWWLAAAAILILALLGAWIFFARDEAEVAPAHVHQPQKERVLPPPSSTSPSRAPEAVQQASVLEKPPILNTLVRGEGVLRGTAKSAFDLIEPVGTVVLDDRPRFRWEATSDATSYDIAIADVESGSVVSGSSDITVWRADMRLRRGRTYSWQVTAHTSAGKSVIAPGPSAPEALFHVAERVDPLPDEPLQRGIALANRGVLDEAERSFALAAEKGDKRANGLLREVRAWRR